VSAPSEPPPMSLFVGNSEMANRHLITG
jgi:hypothetical protein